jgi:hypothetical protein
MTFLHKLAKRLAGIPAAGATLFLLSSCGEGQDYLGPDPNPSKNFISLTISPRDPQIALGDSLRFNVTGWLANGKSEPIQVSWSASGGTINSTGWFRPDGVGDFRVRAFATSKPSLTDSVHVASYNLVGGIARLEVLPSVVGVPRGATQQFVAHAILNDGSTVTPTVAWSAAGGTISSSGLFTASGPTGNAAVTATLGAGFASAAAQIVVQPPVLTQLVLDPGVTTMETGELRQLTLGASWSDGGSSVPPVLWTVEGGVLSEQNIYTAGSAAGHYRIIASSPAFARADTTVVWILPRLVRVHLVPATATLAPGALQAMQAYATRSDGSESPAGVQWTATGGSIGINGTYTAGDLPGQYQVVVNLQGLDGQTYSDTARMAIASGTGTLTEISVTPRQAVIPAGDPLQFSASGNWSDGTSAVPQMSWSATGGSIDAAGLYTAPLSTGSYKVVGKGRNGNHADTATVTVAPKLLTFRVTPKVDTIATGQTRQFSTTLTWSDGQTHPVTIVWSSTGGAISSDGVFSPGMLVGGFLVVATCSCGAADTASVTVRSSSPPASPTLTSLTLSPHSLVLAPGGVQQFTPTGTWSDGQTGPVGVIYLIPEANCGNISSAGFYVAGSVARTCALIAVQQGGTQADTATITIATGTTLNQLVLNPAGVTVAPGATLQFSTSGIWSDGSTSAPAVDYSATGGSITAAGLYTAGSTSGTYAVTATQQGGSLSVTSPLTISSSGPTLTQLVMNPSTVSVFPGSTQLFSVSASWSDGSSSLPPLSFSATGGTISGAGVYTAGTVPGTYRAIVKHQGGTKEDTSAVSIPALTTLTLSPKPASVATGAAVLFGVTGSWSNGATAPPAVTYTATGGTISPAGLYTAGSTAGTYRVIARHTYGSLADTSAVTVTAGALPPPPPPPTLTDPALPALLNTDYSAPTGSTINVAAGGNLQAALNGAACGDVIMLAPGATYTANYVLPSRQCGGNPIHLQTAGPLPPEGIRVTPAVAAGFAKIVSPSVDAALKAAASARGYRIIAVEVSVTSTSTLNYGILRIGEGNDISRSTLPGNVVIDRVFVHGNATGGVQRCIALNGDSTAVVDSWVSDCHGKGFDAQAVAGWNGPGPFKIVNNYLEGSGENILFGGAPYRIPGGAPSDIEVRRNHIYKPLAWRLSAAWSVKNLFELKNASRVLVEANLMENNWVDAQAGSAVLFQSLNDGAGNTTNAAVVQDVTFRLNRVTSSASGLHILAGARYTGDGPMLPVQRVLIEENIFEDIGRADLGGAGRLTQLLAGGLGIRDLRLQHNTFTHSTAAGASQNSAVLLDGSVPHQNLTIRDNVFTSGTYGLFGTGGYMGTAALNKYAGTTWYFQANAMVADKNTGTYPTVNWFPGTLASATMLGSDSKPVGADLSLLSVALAGVP